MPDNQTWCHQDKKKITCRPVNFAVPEEHRVKRKESEKISKYSDLARELKKLWNMMVTLISIVSGAVGMVRKSLEKKTEGSGYQKQNWDYSHHCTFKIDWNTQKSLWDVNIFTFIRPPVKDRQLTLEWKTLKEWYNNNNHVNVYAFACASIQGPESTK